MSEEICFIAGNVSENAGGGRAVEYGVTGRYIAGLEIATSTGGGVPGGRQAGQRRQMKLDFPYEQTQAALLFEVDRRDPDQVAREATIIESLCKDRYVVGRYAADSESQIESFWKIRKRIIWALRRRFPRESVEDIALPIAALAGFLPELERIGKTYQVLIPVYGHAADGNIHATPVKNPQQSDFEWEAMLPELLTDIYRAAAHLGGIISGEHGIGHKRRDFLELVMSPVQIEIMRRIKTALDPHNILNPGKIVAL